jgi:Acetyltransferase (GNAT) domain
MPYSYRLFDSIDHVDPAEWERVRSEADASIFMDPRFIAVAETSMKRSCRFWYIVVHDDTGRAVACACLTAMTVDLDDLADPRLASVIRIMPAMLSRFRELKLFICGVLGAPGEKGLALAEPNISPQVLPLLDDVIGKLAAQTGADAIVYKEFEQDDLGWMQPLLALGYRRIPTPPMHVFPPSFPDFAQYCAALKTRYRQQINRSTRKLQHSGIAQSVLTEPDDILRVYTPEVHALYDQMAAKAEVKLEVLPIEFFRQLAVRLGGQVDLIAFARDGRIIAFGWCLYDASTYHMLYAGLDYRLNDEFDLYFNLMYAGLDRALRKRVAKIQVGQTANAFKARIGCHSEPLYVFAKGRGPVMSRIVRYGANFLVAQKPAIPPPDIFKAGMSGNGGFSPEQTGDL